MLREAEIEVICKERLELQADKGTFGNDGSMLFLDGEEMLVGLAIGEDDGLATEGTDLCAADIKHVAVTGQVG